MSDENEPEGAEEARVPERLTRARDFWDTSADWNLERAIWDGPGAGRIPAERSGFDDAGVEDARALAAFLTPGARVLDLGCGIGRVLRPLAGACREIIGVDISEKMLREARQYLAGVENVRLVHTQGASLPGVEDGSVDFLFSLICLIHVDKRAAFRYLREMRRVLRPGGVALLQFENILSERGLAEFRHVVDEVPDYPLEFYSAPEVRQLARAAGLDVLAFREEEQFLFATLVNGSAASRIARLAAGLRLEPGARSGVFEGTPHGDAGAVRGTLRSSLDEPTPLVVEAALFPAGRRDAPVYRLEAQLCVAPRSELSLEVRHEAGAGTIRVEGAPARHARCLRGEAEARGPLELLVGLAPPGFPMDAATAERFPELFWLEPIPCRLAGG